MPRAGLLDIFVDAPAAAAWLRGTAYAPLAVYARKLRQGGRLVGFELANAEVPPAHRGQGCFRRWLADAECYVRAHDLTLIIRHVANPRLRGFLRRRGYRLLRGVSPSYEFVRPPTAAELANVYH